MNEGGLATLDLVGLAVGGDEGPFGVLLLDRDGVDAWSVCSRDRDMWEVDGDVVEWLESEDHDLADGGAAAFVGLGPVVVDELKGAQVGNGRAFGEEPL